MSASEHTSDSPRFSTLVDLLRQRAALRADATAYTFLSDGEAEEEHLTYGELDRRARLVAARLQAAVRPGERVLLLYPPGLEYVAAFFGCLYAGAVAVPAYPPRQNQTLQRLQAILSDATPRAALTNAAVAARSRALSA
ncbi:MAG TPA: AMP-binding protein, partial [Pyrinomonadaceae bacterium]|nr:AMP-binding protein [Pyrinomonadaceae bacterium]